MYRFSHTFNLVYSDDQNSKRDVPMGCYGLGTSRLMGAIVEALHDAKGIIWPARIAPYDVHLIVLSQKPEVLNHAQELYDLLVRDRIEVLFDDRHVMAGEKFADADLIGIPVRLVVSEKTMALNSIEYKLRAQEQAQMLPVEVLLAELTKRVFGREP